MLPCCEQFFGNFIFALIPRTFSENRLNYFLGHSCHRGSDLCFYVHLSWCDMDSDISSPYVYGVGLGLKVVERISAFWRFVQNGF